MGCGASVEDIHQNDNNNNTFEPLGRDASHHLQQQVDPMVRIMMNNNNNNNNNRKNEQQKNNNRYYYDIFPAVDSFMAQKNIETVHRQPEKFQESKQQNKENDISFVVKSAIPKLFKVGARRQRNSKKPAPVEPSDDKKNEKICNQNNDIKGYLDALFQEDENENMVDDRTEEIQSLSLTVYFDSITGSIVKLSSSSLMQTSSLLKGAPKFDWKPLRRNNTQANEFYNFNELPLQLQKSIQSHLCINSSSLPNTKVKLVSLTPALPRTRHFQRSTLLFDKIRSIFEDPRNLIVDMKKSHQNCDAAASSSSPNCNNNNHTIDFELEMIDLLDKFPTLIYSRDLFASRTCLHILVEDHFLHNSNDNNQHQQPSRRLDIICQLLKLFIIHQGAEVAARDSFGRTVFHLIAQKSHFEGSSRLLQTVVDAFVNYLQQQQYRRIDSSSKIEILISELSVAKDHRDYSALDYCRETKEKLNSLLSLQTDPEKLFHHQYEICADTRHFKRNADEVYEKFKRFVLFDRNEEPPQHEEEVQMESEDEDNTPLLFEWTILHELIYRNKRDELEELICKIVRVCNEEANRNEDDDDDDRTLSLTTKQHFNKILSSSSLAERNFILDLLCLNQLLRQSPRSASSSHESRKRQFFDFIAPKVFDLFCLATRRASTECFELLLQFYTSSSQNHQRVFKRIRKLFSFPPSSPQLQNISNSKNIFHYALSCKRVANKMIPFLLSSNISETIFVSSTIVTYNQNGAAVSTQTSIIPTIRALLLDENNNSNTHSCSSFPSPLELAMSKSLKLSEQNILQQMIVKICGGLIEIMKNSVANLMNNNNNEQNDENSTLSPLQEAFVKSKVGERIIQRRKNRQNNKQQLSSTSELKHTNNNNSSCCCNLPLLRLPLHQRLVNFSIIQQRTSLQNLFLSSELVKLNNHFVGDSSFRRSIISCSSSSLAGMTNDRCCCSHLLCHTHIKDSVVSVAHCQNIDSVFTSWCNNNHNIHFMFENYHREKKRKQSNRENEEETDDDEETETRLLSPEQLKKRMRNQSYIAIIQARTELLGADSAAQFASKTLSSPSLGNVLKKWLLYGCGGDKSSSNSRNTSKFHDHHHHFKTNPLWLSWWLYYPIESYRCDFHTTRTILLRPGLTRESRTLIPNKIYSKHFKSQKTAFPLSGAGKVAHHFLKFAFSSPTIGLSPKEKVAICFAICWCYYVKHFECFGVNFASRYRSVSGDSALIEFALGVLNSEVRDFVDQERERRHNMLYNNNNRNNHDNASSRYLNNNRHHENDDCDDNDDDNEDANYPGIKSNNYKNKNNNHQNSHNNIRNDNFLFLLPFLKSHPGTQWHLPTSHPGKSSTTPFPTTERKLGQMLDIFVVDHLSPSLGQADLLLHQNSSSDFLIVLVPHLIRLFPRIAGRLFLPALLSTSSSSSSKTENIIFSPNEFILALSYNVEFRKQVFSSIENPANYHGFMERIERVISNTNNNNHQVLLSSFFSFKSLLEVLVLDPHIKLVANFFDDDRFDLDDDDENEKINISPAILDKIRSKIVKREYPRSLFAENFIKKFGDGGKSSNNREKENRSLLLPNCFGSTFDPSCASNVLVIEQQKSPDSSLLPDDIELEFVKQHLFNRGVFLAEKYALLDERFSNMATNALEESTLSLSPSKTTTKQITFFKPEHLQHLSLNDSSWLAKLLIFYSTFTKTLSNDHKNNHHDNFNKMANESSKIVMKKMLLLEDADDGQNKSNIIRQTLSEILFRNEASLDWWKSILSVMNNMNTKNKLILFSSLLEDSRELVGKSVPSSSSNRSKMILREIELAVSSSSTSMIKPRPPSRRKDVDDDEKNGVSMMNVRERKALNVVRSN